MSARQPTEHPSLFEAEAFGQVQRAVDLARATGDALDVAATVMTRGNLAGLKDLEKVMELHRLAGVRLEVFARRMGEGVLDDSTAWGAP